MPMGFDAGDGVRGVTTRPPGQVVRPPVSRRPEPVAPESMMQPSSDLPGEPTARAEMQPELEVTVFTVWRTAADERVCLVCGPLDGAEWPAGQGPMPPAHPNCRCARLPSRVEWRVRSQRY